MDAGGGRALYPLKLRTGTQNRLTHSSAWKLNDVDSPGDVERIVAPAIGCGLRQRAIGVVHCAVRSGRTKSIFPSSGRYALEQLGGPCGEAGRRSYVLYPIGYSTWSAAEHATFTQLRRVWLRLLLAGTPTFLQFLRQVPGWKMLELLITKNRITLLDTSKS